MNPNEELGTLQYVSSAPDFDLAPSVEVKPEDVADLTTLERVKKLIRDRQAYYSSIQSLAIADESFSVEQQLAINKKVSFHLQELEMLIDRTIKEVREKLQYG